MKQEDKFGVRAGVFMAVIISATFAFSIVKSCSDVPTPPNENTDLQIHNNAIQRRIIPRKHRIEEAKKDVPKAQKSAQVYFDTVIVYMPDTCKPYLSNYKLFRDSTENLLLYVVASQDSTIRDQDTIIQNQVKMLRNDSIAIRDTVKYFNKKVRKALWRGRLQGAALYAIIREGVNVINNLKD